MKYCVSVLSLQLRDHDYVAHRVEQSTFNRSVAGSIPAITQSTQHRPVDRRKSEVRILISLVLVKFIETHSAQS